MRKKSKGFTLIELLVVIAIIGVLSAIVLLSLKSSIAKARDGRRLAEINQIVKALEVYYEAYGQYPPNLDNDCGGWDTGYMSGDSFIGDLITKGITKQVPIDPISKPGTPCWGYYYYRYNAGANGCPLSKGAFYVLAIGDLETTGRPSPGSPGWKCSGLDWQQLFDWVTGRFEGDH